MMTEADRAPVDESADVPADPREANAPRYLSIKDLAELVGTEGKNLQQLLKKDQGIHVVDPDVVANPVYARDLPDFDPASGLDPDRLVGGVRGWHPPRAIAWGIEIGRLNDDGTLPAKPKRRSWRLPGGPPAHWRKDPVVYLTQTEAGNALGHQGGFGVYLLRRRSSFIPADAFIGDTRVWLPEHVKKFGMRTGRLGSDGAPSSV